MKIKNKILLGITAASGVVASFGAAFALYIKPADGDHIGIGIGTVQSYSASEDGIQYSFGKKADVTGENDGKTAITVYSDDALTKSWDTDQKLDPTHNKVYIKAPISFYYTYDTGETALTAGSEQSYAAGTLKVQIDVEETIAKKGAVVSAKLGGYTVDATNNNNQAIDSTNNYFAATKEKNFINKTFTESDDSAAAGSSFITETGYVDTGVDNLGGQYCLVTLDFSSVIKDENDAFLDVSNITNAFTVTFNWGNYLVTDGTKTRTKDDGNLDENLNPDVFIRGDKSSWKDFNEYRMVPNLKKTGTNTDKVEWMYSGLTGFSKAKVHDKNDTSDSGWIKCRNDDTVDGVTNTNGDAVLNKDKSFDVFYTRGLENTDTEFGFWVATHTES